MFLTKVAAAAVAGIVLAGGFAAAGAAQTAPSSDEQTSSIAGRYIDVNGVNIWVTESGDPKNPAVILLHGALSDSDPLLQVFGADLVKNYYVIAFDRAGHGRSDAAKDAMSYEAMAKETAAVVDKVANGQAALVGWSDGGVTALYTALAYPGKVKRVVTMGSNFNFKGYIDTAVNSETPDPAAVEEFLRHPGKTKADFDNLVEQSAAMWATSPTLTFDDLQNIKVPVLFSVGDDDTVSLAHAVDALNALPLGQLAVIPGASHFMPVERSSLIVPIVREFLDGPDIPQEVLPVRRKNTGD